MQTINEKTHLAIVIGSLDKIYNNARKNGQLEPEDLYYLEAIYKLLSSCSTSMTNTQRNILISAYNNIIYKSKNICPVILQRYIVEPKHIFTQAESDDCGVYPKFDKIYYWQEEDFLTIIGDLIPLIDDTGFFNDKLSDTFEIFEQGKTIPYSNIGRICFGIMESESTSTFEIRDSLDNIVTHTFDIIFIDVINTTLIVSQNIYSHGDMTLKIKKIT